jgi:hypothetical protein
MAMPMAQMVTTIKAMDEIKNTIPAHQQAAQALKSSRPAHLDGTAVTSAGTTSTTATGPSQPQLDQE